MRKVIQLALVLAGALLFTVSAYAQNFITVTGTVTDPNGIPYAGGTMSAVLVPGSSGGYTLGGLPYIGTIGPIALDSTGSFSANFGSNAAILPASTQWQITVNSNSGGIAPPLGTGPQSFTVTMTISGPSPQSISSTLNAAAPNLTNFAAGGGTITSCATSGGIAYEKGTANQLTCSSSLVRQTNTGLQVTAPGLASSATITSISNGGGTSVMTCNIAACGLSVSAVISLGIGTPTACQGPQTITATGGFTASFASASCAGAGPYAVQIGQDGCAVNLVNPISGTITPVCLFLQYDNHFEIVGYQAGGSPGVTLNLDGTIGTAMLESNLQNSVAGIDQNGIVCFGENVADLSGACQGTGYDNSSGAGKGVLRYYRGLNIGTGGDGLSAIVYSNPVNTASPAILGAALGATTLYTCPASGYGSHQLVEVHMYLEVTTAGTGGTMTGQFNYTNVHGTAAQTVVSGSLNMNTLGQSGHIDTAIPCTPSNVISAQTTWTAVTGTPAYAIMLSLELK